MKAETVAEPSTVALEDITAINPPEKKPVSYMGNLSLGGAVTDGNTRTKKSGLNIFVYHAYYMILYELLTYFRRQ